MTIVIKRLVEVGNDKFKTIRVVRKLPNARFAFVCFVFSCGLSGRLLFTCDFGSFS